MQSEDAVAASIGLLEIHLRGQNPVNELTDLFGDMFGSAAIPLRAAIQPVTMVLRQVLSDGRVFIRRSIPLMGSDQCAFIEYLHPIRRVGALYLLSGISRASAVALPVCAKLDVTDVAKGDAHVLFAQKGLLGQSSQVRLSHLHEPLTPWRLSTRAEPLMPTPELLENGLIELVQSVKA